MNTNSPLIKKRRMLLLGGLAAGFLNGLLGAGGGIVIVWILGRVLNDTAADSKDIFACALSVMLPISALSTLSYSLTGGIPDYGLGRFLFPGILGGLLGAFLLDRLNVSAVKILFALLVVLSGIVMVVGRAS